MSLTVWLLEDNRHLNLFWGYHENIKIAGFEIGKGNKTEREELLHSMYTNTFTGLVGSIKAINQ